MRIKTLFQKDICSPDQRGGEGRPVGCLLGLAGTGRIRGHARTGPALPNVLLRPTGDAIDHRHDPDVSGKIGVWVSGFFGSGKSHFIKVLSYLLQNRSTHARWPDQTGGRVLRAQDQGCHAAGRHQARRGLDTRT